MFCIWICNFFVIFIVNGFDVVGGLVVEDGCIVELFGVGQQFV